MSRTNELSHFRSAVEWPEMLPEFEEATGELKPLSVFVIEAIDTLSIACIIAPDCESPIEIDLGARLTKVFRVVDDPNLLLVPQYILGPYRYDFAITRKGELSRLHWSSAMARTFIKARINWPTIERRIASPQRKVSFFSDFRAPRYF